MFGKMILLALVLVFALTAPACGEWIEGDYVLTIPFFAAELSTDEWIQQDTNWQLLVSALIAFDLYQTHVAIKNGGRETGPASYFIGSNPSGKECLMFAASTIAINYFIARILPQPYRKIFQYASVSVESYYIGISWGTTLIF